MTLPAIGIALSALNATQVEMDTVAENLANAQTPGYARQVAKLASVPGGSSTIGSGVTVAAVNIQASALLDGFAQSTSGQAGQAKALAQALGDAQSVLGEPSPNGLQAQLSTFWSDWTAVGNQPTSLAARSSLIGAARQVVDQLHALAAGLSSTTSGTQANLVNKVSLVNRQLAQMATLNREVVAASGAASGQHGLVEQQRALATQLSGEIGANISATPEGSMNVRVGGFLLVQGTNASSLKVSGAGPATSVVLAGGGEPVPLTSGAVSGLVGALTGELPRWSAQLDQVASKLAGAVNAQLAKGVSWSPLGSPSPPATSSAGVPLFVGATSAAAISLNPAVVADPALIAAGSSSAAGPANGANAQALAALANAASGPDAAWRSLVGEIGAAVQGAKAAESATSTAATQAAAVASSTEGVNSNVALTHLVEYRQTYEAAGKVISTAATMIDSLLSAVP
ncbi:MAG: flagellar hook-associated protein FlgK [Acidimicrobiales bacterium]